MGRGALAAVFAAGAFVVLLVGFSGRRLLCGEAPASAATLRPAVVLAATTASSGAAASPVRTLQVGDAATGVPRLAPPTNQWPPAALLEKAREGHSSPSSVGATSAAMLVTPTADNPCPDEALFATDLADHLAWWPDGFLTPAVVNHTWYAAAGQSVDMRAQIINGTLYARSHPRGWHYMTRNPAVLALTRRAVDRYKDVPGMDIPDVDYMWQAADVCHFVKVRVG